MLSKIVSICFKFIYRNVSRTTEPPPLPQIATANFNRSRPDININTRFLEYLGHPGSVFEVLLMPLLIRTFFTRGVAHWWHRSTNCW